MTRRRRILFLCTALTLAPTAFAADLLQSWRDARSFDAQYAAARAAHAAGLEKLPQGRAGLLPNIGFSANTTWKDDDITLRSSGLPTGATYNSNSWGLSLTQPLFRWQNWSSYKQAELAVAAAEAQLLLTGQQLMLRLTRSYFDVLLAQEGLATAQAQKAAITEQLAAAKRNFEVGASTITDTHEAQARFDLATAQEIAADNELAVKRQALTSLTGKPANALLSLRPQVSIQPPQPNAIEPWVKAAGEGSLNVQLAQSNLQIAAREVDKQRAGHYPTVDLIATHGAGGAGFSSFAAGGLDSKSSSIGLQLALPLYSGDLTSSREREAIALHEKARADLDNARRQAQLAARQAYLGVTSGLAQINALEAGLASSQLALQSNKLGYEVGVRINIDVLNAQSQLFDTQQKLAKAKLDTLLAQLQLKAAAGSLSEDDLRGINALLGE